MTLEQAAQPLFANHQTFHPRFGWIKKGYDAAEHDYNAFSEVDAPVKLGVGKNMVEAIRFWATATRVVMRLPDPERPRQSIYVPTRLGQALLSLDPPIGFLMSREMCCVCSGWRWAWVSRRSLVSACFTGFRVGAGSGRWLGVRLSVVV
ncbi:DUF4007 family protein [Gordonia otitidis]|uniref:DUF4007 family protein n=1 Tax=Gordonia otitidis TaxID=249058 RepID=UPI001D14F195|nr:DUF4007 family protein [Gordonia otitidis]UEA60908.1 DUF4007 family protein [Gordonia otitidis]